MHDSALPWEWNLSLSLDLRKGKELHINHESMYIDTGEMLYETIKPTNDLASDITVAYNNFARGGKKPHTICSDQLPIFSQMGTEGKINPNHKKANSLTKQRSKYTEAMLSKILFLDPSPQSMRRSSTISNAKLAENGENISQVIFNLLNPDNDSLISQDLNQKESILNFIKSLPEQNISDIGFLKGAKNDVLITLTETFGNENREIDAGVLSDGTLRVLAIAAALLSAEENSIVIIEEVDNGVHPSRAKQLLNQINKIALQRRLRIILSTHNPALMDALPDEVIPDVVFCYRDKKDGSSKLVSLKDVPDYPELIAQGSLGDLVTEGALSNFVKNYEGSEAKKEKALKWLESIK
jgi:hypothetical protein